LILYIPHTTPHELYTLSLHDALPIYPAPRRAAAHHRAPPGQPVRTGGGRAALAGLFPPGVEEHPRGGAGDGGPGGRGGGPDGKRSEEHTSELQSRENLVCRLLLEKKK